MRYTLNEESGQIIDSLGTVVADVHGLGTSGGRRDVEVILRALNHEPERLQALRRIRSESCYLSESGRATEDDFRRLAGLLAELTKEAAR